MKRLFILPLMLMIFTAAGAQSERRIYTSSELKVMEASKEKAKAKLSKEEKKKLRAMEDSIDHANAVKALETLDFVLEADQLIFKRGRTAFVSSTTNFVSLSDDQAVVQVAPFYGGGPNGVGGITLNGSASNIRVKTDKKGNMTFTMNVMGPIMSATVTVSLYGNGNNASVTVNSNFSSNEVTLTGKLLPTELSSVYKGRAL